jgi:hypothetical protein
MPQVSFNLGQTTRLAEKYVRKNCRHSQSRRQQWLGGANHYARLGRQAHLYEQVLPSSSLPKFHLPPTGDLSPTYIDYFFKIGEPVIVVINFAVTTLAANCYINSANKIHPNGDAKIEILPNHKLKTGELYQGRRVILYCFR